MGPGGLCRAAVCLRWVHVRTDARHERACLHALRVQGAPRVRLRGRVCVACALRQLLASASEHFSSHTDRETLRPNPRECPFVFHGRAERRAARTGDGLQNRRDELPASASEHCLRDDARFHGNVPSLPRTQNQHTYRRRGPTQPEKRREETFATVPVCEQPVCCWSVLPL